MVNDPACVQAVVDAAIRLYGPGQVIADAPMGSGSEDFAWFQKHIPGAYFKIGTMASDARTVYPGHNGYFDFNDDAIMYGSEMFAEIIRSRLPL